MSPRFSERIGAAPDVPIQIGGMDAPLRASLWNLVGELIPWGTTREQVKAITTNVLRLPVDAIGLYPRDWLYERFDGLEWYTVYDIVEFVADHAHRLSDGKVSSDAFRRTGNAILAREHSGYRFVNDQLTPITNPVEISEIEASARAADAAGLDGVRQQIEQALKLFGQRPKPDYRNAIKEAMSAVEGVVKLINGTRGGGLHAALEVVSAKIEMHPALKAGLEKLYGYTSDEDGIRHPILEEANVDEADARFMIVTCSAFVNFLIAKADAAGLLTKRQQ